MSGLFGRLGSAFVAPRSDDAGWDPPASPASGDEPSRVAPSPHGAGRSARAPAGAGRVAAPPVDAGRSAPAPAGAARVAPAPVDADRIALAPAGATLVVLCRGEDALAIGGGLALLAAAGARTSHALLAVWTPGVEGAIRGPATGGARRLAATMATRGHVATAAGRLAVVRLTAALAQAAPEAVRAVAASARVPAVIVLAGARTAEADDLLREAGGIVVAVQEGTDPAVADLALLGLAPLGVPAAVVDCPPIGAAARAAAASGIAVLPPLRVPLAAGLERIQRGTAPLP